MSFEKTLCTIFKFQHTFLKNINTPKSGCENKNNTLKNVNKKIIENK